jgi:hypothetical protein
MSTLLLRQFPGKRRFERVSADDWAAPLPVKDRIGFGHVLRLEADVRVWAPDGELVVARKWPSRSYTANFARIFKNFFGHNVQILDVSGTARTVNLNNTSGNPAGLIPRVGLPYSTHEAGQQANAELGGAGMAIGQGVPAENHQRTDLVSRLGGIASARNNVRTSVLSTSTVTLEVTTGITNGSAGSVNITEIGMYFFFQLNGIQNINIPYTALLAYDGITSTPVAAGGVIAPRYTMDFPI